MNTRRYFLGLGAFLLMIGLFFLSSTQAQAAVKKLNILNENKKKSCNVDLDGDGKKEKLSLSVKYKDSSILNAALFVNDKKAATIPNAKWEYFIRVDYIKLSPSNIFIHCQTSGDNDISRSDYFYRYDSKEKKLIRGANLNVGEGCRDAKIKSVTNSEGKVAYRHQLEVVGNMSWTATTVSNQYQ